MARTLSVPQTCWVMPIDQTSTVRSAAPYMRAKRRMSSTDAPDHHASSSSEKAVERVDQLRPVGRVLGDEGLIGQALVDEDLEHAGQEGDVAAGVHGEELVGHARAEHGASRCSTAPSSAPCPARASGSRRRPCVPRLRAMYRYFMKTGCAFGTSAPKKTTRSDVDDVGVAHGRRGDADRAAQRPGRGRVADARRVVDAVRAQEARHLLGDVVDLVGDARGPSGRSRCGRRRRPLARARRARATPPGRAPRPRRCGVKPGSPRRRSIG